MIDRFERTIDYMRVSVTDRCNLRCVYCMPEEGVPFTPYEEILSFDEIVKICELASRLGIRKIKLTGGEPLVRKGLPQLVKMLKEIAGIDQVTLTTNGILLAKQIEPLVEAGLDAVNISIDTLDPERYRMLTRGGNVEDVLRGLDAALTDPKVHVKVNCVPMNLSKDEKNNNACYVKCNDYVRLALLAKDRPVDVRFIEMMPIGLGKTFEGICTDEVLEVFEEQFGKGEAYNKKLGNGPATYMQYPYFKGRIGFISAMSHQFCNCCNRIRLTSEGFLKPCLQYGTGADLKKLLRSGASAEEMLSQMEHIIYKKPASHEFCETALKQSFEKKEMSRIGG